VRVFPLLLALVLGLACAGLVACGASSGGRLPQSTADQLQGAIQDVKAASDNRDCNGVRTGIAGAQRELERLGGGVDLKLRRRLREGVRTLQDRALTECAQPRTDVTSTTETVETTTPDTQTTETAPQTTTTTIPTVTTPAPTEPTTTTEPPTTTTTTPGDGTGGTSPGDGSGGGSGDGFTPGVGNDTGGRP
jgi:hypothetical protein